MSRHPALADAGERLPVSVADDEAPPIRLGVGLIDGPRRPKAALGARLGAAPERSTALDGRPLAGALAGRRPPISSTATIGQPTSAVRPWTAADDDHADSAAVQDAVTHDAHWTPIKAVVAALQGHDHHTANERAKIGRKKWLIESLRFEVETAAAGGREATHVLL